MVAKVAIESSEMVAMILFMVVMAMTGYKPVMAMTLLLQELMVGKSMLALETILWLVVMELNDILQSPHYCPQ